MTNNQLERSLIEEIEALSSDIRLEGIDGQEKRLKGYAEAIPQLPLPANWNEDAGDGLETFSGKFPYVPFAPLPPSFFGAFILATTLLNLLFPASLRLLFLRLPLPLSASLFCRFISLGLKTKGSRILPTARTAGTSLPFLSDTSFWVKADRFTVYPCFTPL